jgi:hypothetical protein
MKTVGFFSKVFETWGARSSWTLKIFKRPDPKVLHSFFFLLKQNWS